VASPELHDVLELLRSLPTREDASWQERRAGFEAGASLEQPPADVQRESVSANGVPAEWLTAPGADPRRVVLYLHGGGYIFGSINTHRALGARISAAAGARALLIEYRLAPENPFPAAVDDATSAYRYLLACGIDPAGIAIAGDSAGGGLTVATLVNLRGLGERVPAAGVCLSPWVDLEGLGESMTSRDAEDPMIHKPQLLETAAAYLNGADPHHPLAAPLYADLTGLPPLLIQVGTAETLFDDATRLAESARRAGVEVTLEPWEEMFHVFQAFGALLPEAQQAIERIGAFVRERTAAVTQAGAAPA
jgi:acetyl esterase/lipase